MKCEGIDLLEYIEGVPSEEVTAHMRNCKKCQRQFEKISNFSKIVSMHYSEGKRIEEKLEDRLKSIDCSAMSRLPLPVQKKVSEMKEKSLASRIKKAFGKAIEKEERFVESLLRPRLQAMPASPKDITKTKGKKKKKRK